MVAVFLGALVGIGVALVIAKVPQKLLGQKPTTANITPPVSQITQIPSADLTVEILTPEEQQLIETATVTVSGKTRPKVLVLITSPADERTVIAGEDGAFSSPLTLQEGANEIVVVAVDGQNSQEKSLVVNYTNEKL